MLKVVSFSIQEGEFVRIMGPPGSGKTTILNVISTLDKAALLKLEERILRK
ncbi:MULTISPECIES: ATP-binding cassette domain-containing protein [Bacillus]|uniref:ATP-binding cassette domain-containing protein n=1 Tax=Bacillus TaxID=1386 RepID=UPI00268DFF23|nr:ATP-binding cassette domain-containing protein [Bacillus sp. SRB_8]